MRKNIIILSVLFLLSISGYSQVYVHLAGSNTAPYDTWATAATDVQVAINYANSNGIAEVWVAEGTYAHGSQMALNNNVTVYGGFPDAGNPGFGARDYVANPTILDGQLSYRVFYNNGTINNTAILDGFVIENGSNSTGGGFYLRNCSPIIRNCEIRNNNVTADGGGIYLRDADAEFSNCTIKDNHANDDGGGAYMRGAEATFSNCTFTGNNTNLGGGNNGGAIFVEGGDPIFNTVIVDLNNQANDGAGVFINNGNSTFNSCEVKNSVAADLGGGIYINQGAPIFSSCTIDANTSSNHGGGVYMSNSSSPTFTNSTISNNSCTGGDKYGGGFYITGSASPTITSCIIEGNSATNNGGGLYSTSSTWANALDGNQFLNNTCTGSNNNSRGRGAGAYIEDNAPPIINNTFSGNVATNTTVHQYNGSGGALCINGESPVISGNTFSTNRAVSTAAGNNSARGGAIYIMNSTSTISNNTFNNNEAAYGGAIYASNSALTFSGNTYSGNTATPYKDNSGRGGAIYFYGTSGGTGSTITGETFANNTAEPGLYANSGWGGAFFFDANGENAVIIGATIQNNTAENGGAIAIDNGADPTFNRCNITGNTATQGGGLFIDGSSSFKMTNTLIHANNATDGGAIAANGNNDGNYNFLNNTVANNTATNGGGLYCNNSDMRFRNIIFWGNGGEVYLNDGGSDPFFDNCNIEGGTGAFAGGGAGGYNAGRYTPDAACDNQDPLFSDGMFHLTSLTSPCIGTGDAGTAVGDFLSDEDYDGEIRIRGTVDIGAYETNNPPQFVTLPYPPITDNPGPVAVTMDEDSNPTAFSLTLDAIDLDDEDITWSIATQASNGTAVATGVTNPPNAHSLAINYTPNADYFGADMFIVEISDGTLTDQIQVDVTIDPINDPPTFTSTPNPTFIKATNTWTYNISTSDIDHISADLTVTCTSKPAGMTFTPGPNGTATLSWTPGDADLGAYSISLLVEDTGMPVESEVQTFTFTVLSRFINVPADYPTIQEGIDAAVDGDKVVVAAGTYVENVNTNGKNIEIEGNPANPAAVIIDGGASGPALTIDGGGTPYIDGFTMTNGSGSLGLPSTSTLHAPNAAFYGGGILIYQSDPTLKNIIVENNTLSTNNNHGGNGAGIYIGNNSTVIIEGPNTIIQANNSPTYRGGGICIDDSNVTIDGTVANGVRIQNNSSGNYGAGIGAYNSTLNLTDVQISGNSLDGLNARGTGIYYHNTPRNETSVTNTDGFSEKP